MRIDIQARGFDLSPALRAHAERRLHYALGAAAGRLTTLALRLADENGPRSGIDKRCTVRALLPGGPPVVIEEVDSDLYVAIDRAADRTARTVLRRLARSRADRRAGSRAAGSDPLFSS